MLSTRRRVDPGRDNPGSTRDLPRLPPDLQGAIPPMAGPEDRGRRSRSVNRMLKAHWGDFSCAAQLKSGWLWGPREAPFRWPARQPPHLENAWLPSTPCTEPSGHTFGTADDAQSVHCWPPACYRNPTPYWPLQALRRHHIWRSPRIVGRDPFARMLARSVGLSCGSGCLATGIRVTVPHDGAG